MNIQYKILYYQSYRNELVTFFMLFILLLALTYTPAYAQVSVGMITDMDGEVKFINKPGKVLDFGSDISYNDKIDIGKNASLMLTYYLGCRQEWYGENTIIVSDKDHSKVLKGKLLKDAVYDCETPQIIMSDQDSFKKAAFHFRDITRKDNSSYALQQGKSTQPMVNFKLWTVKENNQYFRLGESIVFYLLADQDVYLKLDYFQADDQVIHLIPEYFKDKEKIKAHTIYSIGGNKSELNLAVGRPYGNESIRAMVSTTPFPESFNSTESIEPSNQYEQRLNRLIEELDRSSDIFEFVLNFQTTP